MSQNASDFDIINLTFLKEIETEIELGNFEKAIEIGMGLYFILRNKNSEAENIAISNLYVAFSRYLKVDKMILGEEKRCSFCGKYQSEIKLFAGSESYICVECVDLLHLQRG
jgi:ClpX C4-type zinc finger